MQIHDMVTAHLATLGNQGIVVETGRIIVIAPRNYTLDDVMQDLKDMREREEEKRNPKPFWKFW